MTSCLSPAVKQVEEESSTVPNWLELPSDLTQNILQRLGVFELVKRACLVCPLWWNICKEPIMWRTIDMSRSQYCMSVSDKVKVFMYAIDRSCGQVEDINIQCYYSKDLLEYIADRVSPLRHLRRLRLANSWRFSDELLSKVAKKLPLLEELDILYVQPSLDILEIFAKCCPLLKSLKLDCSLLSDLEVVEFAALKMSRLRHLKFSESGFTNDGLLAILESCPNLESLDVLECYNIDLSECLLKRCHEKIKDFRPPSLYLEDGDYYGDYSDSDYSYNYGSD